MNNEILSILEYMEKQKGIPREDMIDTIVNAIHSGALRGNLGSQDLKVELNPKTGDIKAWERLKVVDSVSSPSEEIHVEHAREIEPGCNTGDTIERAIDPAVLGRIAAQNALQSIKGRLRQFEKDRLYDDYKDSVGDIVSGVVRRKDRNDLIVDLEKTEAILPLRERTPGEDYQPGERIRCLLKKIDPTPQGPVLVLSRASVSFVRRLFELEVTEIVDGTVVLEAISREPGYRTKMAVSTSDPKVDPVGSCVGARGARVKSIVRELGGEKIDIVRYYSDPKLMLEEAIKPAVAHNIHIDEVNHRISFNVSDEDLAVAIGRRGQNARLTAKLLGWKLDISKIEVQQSGFDERVQAAIASWMSIPDMTSDIAQRLVDMGIINPEAFVGVEAEDLIEAGFTAEEAKSIITKVSAHTA